MATLFVMDETGDTRLQWNKTSRDEMLAAKSRFADLKQKGYAAYAVDASGRQGALIHDFDETAERIIMVPPMVGG